MTDNRDDGLGVWRGLRNAVKPTLLLWAVIILAAVLLSGCATTQGPLIGSCPPGQCVGPYDLTLSSHRQALGLED